MGKTTIRIRDEDWKRLNTRRKGPDDTFADVVSRVLQTLQLEERREAIEEELLAYIEGTRGRGHTTLRVKAPEALAKDEDFEDRGAVLVCDSSSIARQFEEMGPDSLECISVHEVIEGGLRGRDKPLLIDNQVLRTLLGVD